MSLKNEIENILDREIPYNLTCHYCERDMEFYLETDKLVEKIISIMKGGETIGAIKRMLEEIAYEYGTEDITDPRVIAEGNKRLEEMTKQMIREEREKCVQSGKVV